MPSVQAAAEVLVSLQQLRVALKLTARARVQQLRLTLERAELHERPPSSARGRPSTSPARPPRAAGYIVVDGQRFDRSIVELARELQAAKKGGGMLGKAEAAKLLADARDGPGVTETERETLRWVCASFGMTRAARSYLLEQCSVPAGWVVK